MKFSSLSEYATQLNLAGVVNCYFVREDDGLTLIDTALALAGKDILARAAATGAPIRRIVLTHAHMDHVGSLDKVAERLPGVEVWMGARETRLYEQAQRGLKPKDFALEPGEPQTPVKGGFPQLKTNVTHQFNDGDTIGSLQAVFAPGHTPGEMAFLDRRDGTLFAGDALVTIGELRVTGDAVWYFPLPNFASWNKPTSLRSAARLAELQPERIACGHGAPLTRNVKAKMAAALDHAGRTFAHS